MPPLDVSQSGDRVTRADECLLRRAYLKQKYVRDQQTGKVRPPASVFEPRLRAANSDAYLSVNILSSLVAEGKTADWGCDKARFYIARLVMQHCHDLTLTVTWEPIVDDQQSEKNNPHHGGIWGVVEAFYRDKRLYEHLITELAAASEVIPECL